MFITAVDPILITSLLTMLASSVSIKFEKDREEMAPAAARQPKLQHAARDIRHVAQRLYFFGRRVVPGGCYFSAGLHLVLLF